MRAFYGGQIKEECRGDLAVVIAVDLPANGYDVFMYPVNSKEFINLTGVRAVSLPPCRVYMGISHKAGEEMLKSASDRSLDLPSLDKLVVTPYFLKQNLEKPHVITLTSTSTGYEVMNNE